VNAPQNAINRGVTADLSRRLCVEVLDPLEHAAYDELVVACPDNVPFHSRAWLRVIRDTYGHRPLCFVAKDRGGVVAMLPIVEVQSWITGRRGVMLPFADLCPPMASDAAAYGSVFTEAVQCGRERGWKYLEFRGGRKWMQDAKASVAYYAHTLDLSAGSDKLFGRFDSPTRRAIRKAEREGVRVEVSNSSQAIQIYYTLHCETRKKHGVPPQPFSFFQNLFWHLIAKEAGVVVVAWHRSVPIAAAVFLHHGRQAIYKFGASNGAFLSLRGNNMVHWEAIRWYANQGFSSLHFGRTSFGNEGLRRYKAGWGSEETTLEYFRYSIPKQAYIVDPDRSEGGYKRFLSLLPGPLFRLAGRMLYRHLS
jgi:hypothetical protein